MFRNSKLNMILSVILAVVLWLYVTGQVDPRTDKEVSDIEIQFVNLEELHENGYDFASAGDESADVTVEGKRSVLNSLSAEDIVVTASLSKCSEGKNTIKLKAKTPKNVDVDRISPSTVTVNVEERISKEKPVKIKYIGKKIKGREPGDITLQYDKVTVEGAESLVNKVAAVEVEVELEKVKDEYVTLDAKATAVDKNDKKVGGAVPVPKSVEVTTALKYVKEVPLKVETTGKPFGGKQLGTVNKPKKVFIKGRKNSVDNITEISTETLDLGSVTKQGKIPVKPILPYGCELADASKDISVEVVFK